mmetsp:Transcript_45249/g.119542  ORF Transcript_45249/g.119542 Transcript_45249/m.119542 type:complete len:215 (-) Transcript_45249:2399-3043(-)
MSNYIDIRWTSLVTASGTDPVIGTVSVSLTSQDPVSDRLTVACIASGLSLSGSLPIKVFRWVSISFPIQWTMNFTSCLSTKPKPPENVLVMSPFTVSSSSFSVASAEAESTLVRASLTRRIPSLPCSSSRRRLKLCDLGRMIVTGMFNFMAMICSKIVQMRDRYRGPSQVSSSAKTWPMRARLLSKTCSRSWLPVFSLLTMMRYWLFTKKHMYR